VTAVTTEGGADFAPAEARIATFDNDGTLWIEQPFYTQFAFALDRVTALAPQHPEWATTQHSTRCSTTTCARSWPAARRASPR
jgi:hypothetical protein